jgi:hypothetical protein
MTVQDDLQLEDYLNPIDAAELAAQYRGARPFPYFATDAFLRPEFAEAVCRAYPDYEQARKLGKEFGALNERLKVQITDPKRMPDPVARLSEVLASQAFLGVLERVTGIPRLLADPQLRGGGMHLVGPGGRLDVHVDFNIQRDTQWFRRLNILVFLNEQWERSWGGCLELWNSDVTRREHEQMPLHNRCLVFETSESSYHGVAPVTCPEGVTRQSFAAYYYTAEAPAQWSGAYHTTVFKPRPGEWWRHTVGRPAERLRRMMRRGGARLRRIGGVGS